ncbi:glycine--tRNA ligase subunit beta [Gracilibacillus dipsosauri]|uniref:Glycine--tRNA ligase beta subunit n=1 Tax=Gracilibacillus dipsosauri TaxID=178340 RepID=A0A317KY77_9BACI|nr:glycine--tRNA ligase subunit beta [Gracilibacillus dipsosauri]PWU68492.1 glycine--tRNA ligase subunit beta [Gracilibacillus dipsosauri]
MKTTNVLFEIGLEEMPARFMDNTEKELKEKTINWLEEVRLSYQKINTYITPRRFAVLIEGLQLKQEDQVEEAKGPAEKIAKDENGGWTKAAIGFSKGQGKTVEDLYMKSVKGTNYVFVKKFIEGKSTVELLPQFKEVILNLHFPKSMRWANESIRYIRPIKWIVALQDHEVIPLSIAGVKSSNITYGHRFLGGKITIDQPLQYEQLLEREYVIAVAHKREQLILEGIKRLEEQNNWQIPVDQDLLTEVKNLVEFPTVFSGKFHESFLHLPKEVLITTMKEHQRYFPVQSTEGELYPYFIGVRNGTAEHIDTVARGNEKVLRARLQDAQFFYEEDQKQSIERNIDKLTRMVFQEKLGTIADKSKRIVNISEIIVDHLGLSEKDRTLVKRAAEICKFDLVTNMVTEFTELQGIMGRNYAYIFGEDPAVAQAIEEQYMPRHANAALPESIVGTVVSIADKLDTIVGCFSVGLIPSGSQDPYALRRQALGVIQMIAHQGWSLNLDRLVKEVQALYSTKGDNKVLSQLESFFKQRVAYIMKEDNIEADVIDAVLINELVNISFVKRKALVLSEKRNDPTFKAKQEAYVRVINLANKAEKIDSVRPELFENEQEKQLFGTYQSIQSAYLELLQQQKAQEALTALDPLVQPIHQFFDHTMVMADNEMVRANRLSLLSVIAKDIKKFADLTLIQWKQVQG